MPKEVDPNFPLTRFSPYDFVVRPTPTAVMRLLTWRGPGLWVRAGVTIMGVILLPLARAQRGGKWLPKKSGGFLAGHHG